MESIWGKSTKLSSRCLKRISVVHSGDAYSLPTGKSADWWCKMGKACMHVYYGWWIVWVGGVGRCLSGVWLSMSSFNKFRDSFFIFHKFIFRQSHVYFHINKLSLLSLIGNIFKLQSIAIKNWQSSIKISWIINLIIYTKQLIKKLQGIAINVSIKFWLVTFCQKGFFEVCFKFIVFS